MEKLLILRNNAAVDATIFTKGSAVPVIADYFQLPLEKIATIGDEIIDLPMLTYPGVGFVGAPCNSQETVLNTVRQMKNGYISSFDFFRGFKDFYNLSKKKGIELVISDRDGVIKSERKDEESEKEFHKICLEMGKNGPYIAVLTGSSIGQNIPFVRNYGFDERLKDNSKVLEKPYLLYVESGAIHYNILTGETKNYISELDPKLLGLLKGEFEQKVVLRVMNEVFPLFDLTWTQDIEDKTMKVYRPQKLSMVTIDLPRFKDDGSSFRKSTDGETFRNNVARIMMDEATKLGINFELK